MSWRETLGVSPSAGIPSAHNSHNTQKSIEPDYSAYCADSSDREAERTSLYGSGMLVEGYGRLPSPKWLTSTRLSMAWARAIYATSRGKL